MNELGNDALLIFVLVVPLSVTILFIVACIIPMPKWRERQLERRKPMHTRIIDI